jgi:hypothetical protein
MRVFYQNIAVYYTGTKVSSAPWSLRELRVPVRRAILEFAFIS